MAFYENVFIVRQDVSATQVETLANEFGEIVKQNGGEVKKVRQVAPEVPIDLADLIDRLVDFHVAHDATEAEAGRGFDYLDLKARLEPRWRLVWFKSYSYMGPQYEPRLPQTWQRACRTLADQHPLDGANFCSAWQRVAS